jgi:hypothetical protein
MTVAISPSADRDFGIVHDLIIKQLANLHHIRVVIDCCTSLVHIRTSIAQQAGECLTSAAKRDCSGSRRRKSFPAPDGIMESDLFRPMQMGRYRLANRIVVAPLMRSRARDDGIPHAFLKTEYYAQRARVGLIIGEGTNMSPQVRGYSFTPGLFTAAQVASWQPVTEAVHGEGGQILV